MRTKAEEIVVKINDVFSDNWDYIEGALGRDIAEKLDQAYIEIKSKESWYDTNKNNEVENL